MRQLLWLIFLNIIVVNVLAQRDYPKPTPSPGNAPGPAEVIRSRRLHIPLRALRDVLSTPSGMSPTLRPVPNVSSKPSSVSTHGPLLKPSARGAHPLDAACINKSFFLATGLTNCVMYAGAVTNTQDGGALIAGQAWDSTAAHPGWIDWGYVIRVDVNGNVVWVSLLENQANGPYTAILCYYLKEMPGGDIMMAAYADYEPNGTSNPVTTIYHLTSSGTILWHHELQSNLLSHQAYPQWSYLQVNAINAGQNGDYIIAGETIGINSGAQGMAVVRVDANGNYVWDMNITNRTGDYDLGSEGLNAFLNGNSIIAVGLSHGSSLALTTATFFAQLDYATGNVQSKTFWDNVYANPSTDWVKNFTYYTNRAVQLNNGHYLVYGQLMDADLHTSDTVNDFGVQEFDANLHLVRAYRLCSIIGSPYENNSIYFDADADGFISLLMPLMANDYKDNNWYFSSLRNNQLARQRVTTYAGGIQSGGYPRACFTNDGGYFVADDFYDDKSGSAILMKKMFDTDTASVCLGRDTSFIFEVPQAMRSDPTYYYLDPPEDGQFSQVSYTINQAPIGYHQTTPCLVNSSCSLLQIQGPAGTCGAAQPMVYTAHRNWGCGATPQWNIDASAVTSITPLNDSMISIQFKDANWHGKLYAALLPTVCSMGMGDSAGISVVGTPQPPVLVADTTLCTGNTIVLRPGPVFSSYLWQDGSTDSNYSVRNVGTYRVAVTDACGNNYTASTQVVAANFPFSLGADITKCNGDTVTLKATGGFFDYQWMAADLNQTGTADSVVRVDPVVNETYNVTAQKWAGCFVNSSVQVNVLTSPAIHLGNDTSFCAGGYKLLDAGAGFSSYLWNTGQTSEQIEAAQAGAYSVAATAGNGCVSRDTLKVDAIYPLPQFSLGPKADTTICSNQTILYLFPDNTDQYLWSDGATAHVRVIDAAGIYGLTVTSPYGCTVYHGISVSVKAAPVVDLGSDTTLCSGSDLVLKAAVAGGQYVWQDGNTAPDFKVTHSGIYSVQVTANGCAAADSIVVTYIGTPKFHLGQDTALCEGEVFALKPAVTYAGNFLWQDGSTQNYFIVKDTGTYALQVTNICGVTTGVIRVAQGLCKLVMPNAFTPNSDGHNDVFRIKYPFTVSSFFMVVYDRWGQEVFRTKNIAEGWDGTIHGVLAPAGTYVWYISLVDMQKRLQNSKGTLELIR
jgi:gliding motility-associated-like protein